MAMNFIIRKLAEHANQIYSFCDVLLPMYVIQEAAN